MAAINLFTHIQVPQALAYMLGSLCKAAIVQEARYYTDCDQAGWFSMTEDEWCDRLGLSKSELGQALYLLSLDSIWESRKGLNGATLFRLNLDLLAENYERFVRSRLAGEGAE
jgi:hypothetical protein